MKKRELLKRIDALEQRISDLEAQIIVLNAKEATRAVPYSPWWPNTTYVWDATSKQIDITPQITWCAGDTYTNMS